MTAVPRALRREIAEHNSHCWMAAVGALLFAWLAWLFFYAVFVGAVLLFETIRSGEAAVWPSWTNPVAGVLAGVLLAWGAVDAWQRRFRPPPDRPIIGWHLLPGALLLPSRLTFAIGEQLAGRIRLDRHQLDVVWQLIQWVADSGRVPAHELAAEFNDRPALARALDAVQTLGWIDLHAGEEGWFYRLRGTREEELARWRGEEVVAARAGGEPDDPA